MDTSTNVDVRTETEFVLGSLLLININRKPPQSSLSATEAKGRQEDVYGYLGTEKGQRNDNSDLIKSASPSSSPEILIREMFSSMMSVLGIAKWLLQEFMLFPTSYNQVLITGILAYCIELLTKIDSSAPNWFTGKINLLIKDIENLFFQFHLDSNSFSLLNLQIVDDKFDTIQEKSKERNLLPALDKLEIFDL